MARNIPLSIDNELLVAIDRVAGDRNETRSLVMRKAIEQGLPLVKAGANADVLSLDSEISADVDEASKELKLRRNKILLEAIRIGLQAFISRAMSEKVSLADVQDPKEKEMLLQAIEQSYKDYHDPMVIEHRRLIAERGHAITRLNDILQHVPEAKRRSDLVNRLTEFRRAPGGPGGGSAWRCGLSTDEIEYQVKMSEKFPPHPANWPEEIKKAHMDWDAQMRGKYGFDYAKWPQEETKAHFAAIDEMIKKTPKPAGL